jgi:hypothetical protein
MCPLLVSLLAHLSQDSNILRKFVMEDEGRHDVQCVLVKAWSCDAATRTEERMAAAMTAAATFGHAA